MKSFWALLTNYQRRNHCKHYLVILINYYQGIIWHRSFKLLSENHCKQYTHTTYYLRNQFWQFLQTTTREITANSTYKLLSENHSKQFTYVHTIIDEITPNKSYKLLQEKLLQIVLTNYYHRNHSKKYLQTITREIIANYAYKSLSGNSIHFK